MSYLEKNNCKVPWERCWYLPTNRVPGTGDAIERSHIRARGRSDFSNDNISLLCDMLTKLQGQLPECFETSRIQLI